MKHPLLRKSHICPLCDLDKSVGLVACWPCFRLWDMRYGNDLIDEQLDTAEAHLEARERNAQIVRAQFAYWSEYKRA
jgi:hypothetical protein